TAALVDERLRQAAPLHRQAQGDRRVLPQPGRRADRDPPFDQSRAGPLPLAGQTNDPPPPLTIICRSLLGRLVQEAEEPDVSLLNLAVDSTITRLMKQMERLFVAALTVCWDGD